MNEQQSQSNLINLIFAENTVTNDLTSSLVTDPDLIQIGLYVQDQLNQRMPLQQYNIRTFRLFEALNVPLQDTPTMVVRRRYTRHNSQNNKGRDELMFDFFLSHPVLYQLPGVASWLDRTMTEITSFARQDRGLFFLLETRSANFKISYQDINRQIVCFFSYSIMLLKDTTPMFVSGAN